MMQARESLVDGMLGEIAFRTGIPADAIRGHQRTMELVDARHTYWLALSLAGMRTYHIALHVGFDHSTVLHGMRRAAARQQLAAMAQTVAELSGRNGARRALHRWLERGLRSLTPYERSAVEAYAVCSVLGWERRPGTTCVYGLLLVMATPGIRAALDEALRRCDQAAAIGLIDLQAELHRRGRRAG
jgi:hypothetical protein